MFHFVTGLLLEDGLLPHNFSDADRNPEKHRECTEVPVSVTDRFIFTTCQHSLDLTVLDFRKRVLGK